ncbi:MAG: hypothetical protein GY943_33615 [Chloroflexi bacterium]|nr:hypothetical protein [Chloroflexota bacterium]
MLKRVLHEIESAKGPIHLTQLSQKLGIERSALDGMITFWIRKGRLRDDDESEEVCAPSVTHCGSTCAGPSNCTFIAKMPKSYSLRDNS